MSSIMNLVLGFVEAAKNLRPEYIELWLQGKVKDYDMDMTLIEEPLIKSSISDA